MVTITVKPEPRVKAGLMPSLINPAWTAGREQDQPGWYAEIEVDGLALQLSRLDGEGAWTIDAAFRAGTSMPIWMNGYGARYLLTKTLKADLAAQVDAAMAYAQVSDNPEVASGQLDGLASDAAVAL